MEREVSVLDEALEEIFQGLCAGRCLDQTPLGIPHHVFQHFPDPGQGHLDIVVGEAYRFVDQSSELVELAG
jgi:hypothetical protein